jgi:NOL1/NOP2/sun family putative RNA methylase
MEQTQEKIKEYKYNPKPEFEERMNKILELSGSDENDKKEFWRVVHTEPLNFIRCNTLKINPKELVNKLEEKGWKISQPYKTKHPEIILIENPLMPGELGSSEEHLLGYYYVQELSSMLPILALNPSKEDNFLDLCASPGSKTTQAASKMENSGNIIANDDNLGRMIILASNLEKCGVSNAIITRRDGVQLCKKLKTVNFLFDKILVDVPCSGEGTLRSSPQTFLAWNIKTVENLSKQQKVLASSALEVLKEGGELIYSTCTHSPEENEEVIQFLLDNFNIQIEEIKKELPVKAREGLSEWQGKKFNKEIKKCCRVYPQDNNSEGFFLCKIKKLGEKR